MPVIRSNIITVSNSLNSMDFLNNSYCVLMVTEVCKLWELMQAVQ
jgi:hypothetical protein